MTEDTRSPMRVLLENQAMIMRGLALILESKSVGLYVPAEDMRYEARRTIEFLTKKE